MTRRKAVAEDPAGGAVTSVGIAIEEEVLGKMPDVL
jgi:hypothetical protein